MSPLEKNWEGIRIFRNQKTRISQDLLGTAPLLYTPFPEGVLVGQTYGELFATKLVEKKWRREALMDFLAAGTVVFPGGQTFFEGVFEVPPGHDLHISGNKASVTLRQNLPEPREELGKEALPLLREELIRSLGEIPEKAGLCLSGGLDSTSLAAAWAPLGTPRCFLYAASETPDKELALEAAQALKITPFLLEADSRVSLEELEQMLKILEIPLHIPLGPLPQFRLLQAMAKEGITTVYSGQGGDELFCGYPWHFPLAMKKLALRNPEKAEAWEVLHQGSPPFGPLELRLTRRSFTRTESWVTLNDGGACHALGLTRKEVAERPGVRFFAADSTTWEEARHQGLRNRSLRYLLHYDHRLTKHFDMEGRAPFLSKGMVDLVSRFKLDFLYAEGLLKYPLRHLFPEIPEKVRFHTRKTGFWHNGPGMPDLLPEVLRMLEETELGNLVKAPEVFSKITPAALWRFYSAGVLLEENI
jgi:asparagine synthase (glutamine-hydrolysing)